MHQKLPNVEGRIVVIGDQKENFKRELRNLLQKRQGEDIENQSPLFLDIEPFETLCKMLRGVHTSDTIGVASQMIKAYQYMNSCPVGVYWPQKVDVFSNRTCLGRRLFDYENTSYWFIALVTLYTNPCIK